MTSSATRCLLLVLAYLCPNLAFGQTDTRNGTAAPNLTSFSTRKASHHESWKRFNQPQQYRHPEFGILPDGAPNSECVELLDRRQANRRFFRSLKDTSEVFIQQSLGDLNYLAGGQWLTIDDKLRRVSPGRYLTGSYPEAVSIDVPEKRSAIHTPQGKVYFNRWSLYAQTEKGEVLLDQADWSHYTAGDDGILIHDIFKGIDAELRVYRGTIKTSFIIRRNAYGVFDQLIFRDSYQAPGKTSVAFAGEATGSSAISKLAVYSGNHPVLKVNEAVIYPRDGGKDEVLTTPYAISDNKMDVLVPYSWISTHIDGHELVIDPTVTGTATLNAAAIGGSRYNASCSFDSSCNYNLTVSIPAATTITGVLYSFTYQANAPCFGSDGAVKFSTGGCATGYFTNQSQTTGPTVMNMVPITNDVQGCIPAPSCSAQDINFTMQFFRSCKGPAGCDNSCIGALTPWVMTLRGKTVEFNDPMDPISYTTTNVCMGDSVYVSTWASYGVPPYNYNWSFNASGTPSLGTGASTSITFPNILNHTIFAIITDACGNTTTDSLPVTVNYAAVTATPAGDTLCSGETTAIQLTAPIAGTTFSWTVQQNGAYGASAGSGSMIAQTLTTTGDTPGTVVYTITPHNGGCDGVPLSVTILVNPPILVLEDHTVCVNQLPFSWNNQLIYGGGAYIANITVPSLVTGCDSTTVLNLTVAPVPVVMVERTICASQLPYSWNGISVTAGGNGAATVTSTGVNNCDSITSLNLHVVNTLTETVNVTICASQLPYSWNGISVNDGGATAATVTNTSVVSGCDSITTLNLTVNPLSRDTVHMSLCSNQLPLNWNGQTISSGGPAIATYTTSSVLTGCDSTTTLDLVVHQPVLATLNRSICASQLPYAWNGQTLTAGGNAVATYTTPSLLTGCDSTTTLNLTVNPSPSVIRNVTICASQMPYLWNGITVTAGGPAAAVYTISSASGCDSITTLNLTVNPVLTATVSRTICAGQLPYSWNGMTVTTGGAAAAVFTTAAAVTGCDSTTTLNLTVNPVQTATVNRTICAAQLPYSWNGLSVAAGGTAAAVFTTSSVLTGCDSTTTLNLTVNPVLTATVSRTICASQLPYSWNGLSVAAGGNTAATFTTASPLTGCDSTTTLNLTVNPLIQVTKSISICTAQLPYTWNGQLITTGGPSAATFTTSSLLTGCDSTTTLNLTVNPSIAAIRNVTICAGQMPYLWNGITVTAGGSAAAVFTTPSAASGCDSITTLNLTVNPVLTATVNRTICTSQLPYAWNGMTVTAGGAAAAVFTTAAAVTGCDSTTTLNLTVNPVQTATVNRTICAAQLPYSWNGLSVAAGGTAAAVFTMSSVLTGCDSTTTLNLTVNPVLTATVSRTICASQLPYSWNGLSVTTGGSAAATFTTPSPLTGCDSTTTLNLTVNPLIQVTKSISICTAQLPYTWNGQLITTGGPAAATFTTASLLTGCDSTTTLNLQVNPVINAIRNQTICAGQLPYTWNGTVISTGGTAVATYTTPSVVSGCDSVTTLNLNINPVLTTVRNITICAGQLPYHWNGITVTTAGSGVAIYTVSSAVTGCDSSTILNLAVVPVLRDTLYRTICANQLPYLWNGINVTSGGSVAAQYTTAAAAGCDSITTLNLTVKQVFASTIDTSICYAQAPYQWQGQSYTVSGNYPHTFSSVAGCDSVITLALHVSAAPVTLAPRDSAGCGQVLFKGRWYTSNTTVKDTLLNARGCDSAYRTTHLKILTTFRDTLKAGICANETYTWMGETYKESGLYSRTFSMPSGCDSVLNLALTVWNISQAEIVRDLDETPCLNDTITVTAQGAQDYTWKWNGNDLGNDIQRQMVLTDKVNVIRLLAKDEHGCASEAEVTIETVACCEMMIPNAFSPNGDGLNDRFGPETIGNPRDFKMMIFNRYGQLLFTSISVNSKWDGTFQGKPVDLGTYYYRIYTKCTNDTESTFKGDITLIR